MPNDIWVPQYISNGETESGLSGTLRKDLPRNEQLSHLMLELRVTNTSTVNNLRSILDVFTKIEVIADGSKTLYSLTAEQASYLAFVAQGGVCCDHRFFDGAVVNRLHLPLYFGRYPWDKDYLLDTSRYNNVQLVITWAMNGTYETTGTFTHTITYWRPLDRLAPLGIVRSREVRNQASPAASAEHTHDLPTLYPWHYLAVRVHDVDQDINTNLSQLKLSVDAGRELLYDVNVDEIYYQDKLRYSHARGYVSQPVVTGQDTVHTFAEWAFPRGLTPVVLGARIPTFTSIAGEQGVLAVYTDGGVQASDAIPVAMEVNSQNPHKCLTLFDGRKTPYPAPGHSEAEITYKTGSTAPDNLMTFVQELVPGAL